MRPTTPEREIMHIIEKHALPFKYVGNGTLIVDHLNPDFVHTTDKKIVEVFGDYWHDIKNCKESGIEEIRRRRFSKHGYQTHIIWEKNVKNEEYVLDFLKKVELS